MCEIIQGRRVRDVEVLERIADGLGMPRGWMRLGPGEEGPSAGKEVAEDVKRRALISATAAAALGRVAPGPGEPTGLPLQAGAVALAAGYVSCAGRGGGYWAAAWGGAVLRRAGRSVWCCCGAVLAVDAGACD
ncbi:MAG: hypothetical protein ACRDRP_19350 [Pseudonocardiaceae bacterium]